MGYENNIVSDSNISIVDIKEALLESSYTMSVLWTSANINKWSKNKPQQLTGLYGLSYNYYNADTVYGKEALINESIGPVFNYIKPDSNHGFKDFRNYYSTSPEPFDEFQTSDIDLDTNSFTIAFGVNTNGVFNNLGIDPEDIGGSNGTYYVLFKQSNQNGYQLIEQTKDNLFGSFDYTFQNLDSVNEVTYTGCIIIAIDGVLANCVAYPNSYFNVTLPKYKLNLIEDISIELVNYRLVNNVNGTYTFSNGTLKITNNSVQETPVGLFVFIKGHADEPLFEGNSDEISIGEFRTIALQNITFEETTGTLQLIAEGIDKYNNSRTYYIDLISEALEPIADIYGTVTNSDFTNISGTVYISARAGYGNLPAGNLEVKVYYSGSASVQETWSTYVENGVIDGQEKAFNFSFSDIPVPSISKITATYYGTTSNLILSFDILSYTVSGEAISNTGTYILSGSVSVSLSSGELPAQTASIRVDYKNNTSQVIKSNIEVPSLNTTTSSWTLPDGFSSNLNQVSDNIYNVVFVYNNKEFPLDLGIIIPKSVEISNGLSTATSSDTHLSGSVDITVTGGTVNSQYVYFDFYVGNNVITTTSVLVSSFSNSSKTVSFTNTYLQGYTANNVSKIITRMQYETATLEWQVDIEDTPGPSEIPVTSISINKASVSINKNSTTTIIATVSPSDAINKKINWSISQANIELSSTISNSGDSITITALNVGTCTITAYSDYNNSIQAQCTVEIIAPNVPVTGLTINNADPIRMYAGDYTSLDITIYPEDASNQSVTITSSNSNIARIEDSNIYGVTSSSSPVTITATSNSNSSVKDSITVYVSTKPSAQISASVDLTNTGTTLNGTVYLVDSNNITTNFSTTASIKVTFNNGTIKNYTASINSSGEGTFSGTVTNEDLSSDIDIMNCSISTNNFTLEAFEFNSNFTIAALLTGVSISPKTLTFTDIGQTSYVSYSYIPSNATNVYSIMYVSSNVGVASVNSTTGLVTAKGIGTCNISILVTDTNSNLFMDACSVSVFPPVEEAIKVSLGQTEYKYDGYSVTLNLLTLQIEWATTETVSTYAPIYISDQHGNILNSENRVIYPNQITTITLSGLFIDNIYDEAGIYINVVINLGTLNVNQDLYITEK